LDVSKGIRMIDFFQGICLDKWIKAVFGEEREEEVENKKQVKKEVKGSE